MKAVLISTYELGRQPFGLASPAAWLRAAGADVTQLDLSRQELDRAAVSAAGLVAFYLPMHTATRLAMPRIDEVRALNPGAHLCAYGLYAPVNGEMLRAKGVATILGGEPEQGLRDLCVRLGEGRPQPADERGGSKIPRLNFLKPDRTGLPPLERYARLTLPEGGTRVVGYTEASRGCKHLCRHCPIVPVYGGAFRVVQSEVVLGDIRQQVAAGAEHITFGDPDFFNGPGHAMEIVEALHREFPQVSYDATIKIEHLRKHAALVERLQQTGCAFVTSAVESLDDRVLALLEKGHTRADFLEVAGRMRELGLFLVPTFVAFTPWTTLEGLEDLMETVAGLELADHVPPVQYTLRLLVPAGSRLREVPEVERVCGAFDAERLVHPWRHADARVDALQEEFESTVQRMSKTGASRRAVFRALWQRLQRALRAGAAMRPEPVLAARATVPYLTEPWYC